MEIYVRTCEYFNMQTSRQDISAAGMAANAEAAARLLAILSNAKRLMALCNLLDGEMPVGRLAEKVGLAPATLSQHLARLRDLRLVETRRAGQTIHYRLASPEIRAILETLYRLYCAAPPAVQQTATVQRSISSQSSSAPSPGVAGSRATPPSSGKPPARPKAKSSIG